MTATFMRARLTGASSLALGCALMIGASPAAAQDAGTPATTETTQESPVTGVDAAAEDQDKDTAASPAPTAPEEESDEIVVTGFRAALQSAVNTKKRQEQIVESVTAEDIGKLPDASIGESIARLPGVTSQRLNGRANVIAIRGLGPDFSQTLLNGREQTSTGDNRGVEFDQYPSEVVSQVVVYKTPSANLVGQGLVGTVDIRTIRPLDYGKQVLAIGARGSLADIGKLNAGSKDRGFRVNATYVDQFADDRLGVSVAGSYVDEPYQNQEFNAWGYADVGGNAVIGGSKSYVTSTQLKRFGLNGTLQGKLSDALTLTADAFYSNFDDDQFKRGIELPLGFGGGFDVDPFDPTGATSEDGTYTSGTFNDVRGVVRNDIFNRQADLYSFGLNARFNPGNGWKGYLDFGWSRTEREELSIESYSGTGYNGDGSDQVQGDGTSISDNIDFRTGRRGTEFDPTLDYSDPNLIRLTDPLGWGGSRIQAGYYNNRIVKDDLEQYRGEIEREFTETSFLRSIQVGLNYTDRDKSLRPDEFFVTLPNGATIATIPAEFLQRPTNLDYLGLGPIVSYDARDLIDAGVLVLDRNTSNDIPAKAFSVTEKLLTGYVQANLEAEIGVAEITGNVGVQVVRTDQSSQGLAFSGGQGTGTPVAVEAGDKYTEVLPSASVNARLPGDFVVRLGLSRQLQRPRLDDLRVAIGYSIDQSGEVPIIRGGGGNPTLRPYKANAIDFTVEKYFGGSGYVAGQLFYKDIKQFIYGGRIDFDYANFPLPAGPVPPSTVGTLDAPINTGGGKLYGGELAATLPLSVITPYLEGFGVTGGVGYTKSKVRDQNGVVTAIPGYSKWVANGTAFYERYGFNARGSVRYRSTFLGDFTGFGGTPTRRQALEETIVDAQIGYDFQPDSALEGLSLYLQGQNLTDERFASVTNTDNPLQVIDYQIYGRRFLAGFTYKF